MENKKSEWIEHIIDSAEELKPVDASPFLYQKIIQKIKSRESMAVVSSGFVWKMALGFIFLLLLNLASLKKYTIKSDRTSTEIGYYTINTEYNY